MHRLSIVIPCLVFNQDVEDTLVSVLQNRPRDTEVIVVTAGEYDDPYELAGEVTFVQADEGASLIQLVNEGFESAGAAVVHLLQPGARAVEGWTDEVLAHFEDAKLGALSPALVRHSSDTRAVGLGVGYWLSGVRRVLGKGSRLASPRVRSMPIVGPSFIAGFYRRDLWEALGRFDDKVGPDFADVDLGLSLQQLGFRSRVEPSSRVVNTIAAKSDTSALHQARQAEILYRRYRPVGTAVGFLHALFVMLEALASFPRPQLILRLCGRFAGRFSSGLRERQQERLRQAEIYLADAAERETLSTIPVTFVKKRLKQQTSATPQLHRRAA